MNKYLYDIFCIFFKLLKLNFLEYCIFKTMHDLIYGNFDQVYACWEITDFVCKMLEYCSKKTDQKRVIQFLALGRKRKKKTIKSGRKLLGNYVKCSLSVHWF